MKLNDKITFQEINMDREELSYDIKAKELEAYWINECGKRPTHNH